MTFPDKTDIKFVISDLDLVSYERLEVKTHHGWQHGIMRVHHGLITAASGIFVQDYHNGTAR